jgi:elongation factor G
VRFAAEGGLDLGYPVIDVACRVTGGRTDEALSTEVAFHAAASEAFKEACERAGRVLLEPVMRLEVTTPADFVGPIQSDLARRGAVIEGDELRAGLRVIRGTVPLSKMFGYSTSVRSLTQGRAGYSMEPAGYAPVHPEVAKSLLF